MRIEEADRILRARMAKMRSIAGTRVALPLSAAPVIGCNPASPQPAEITTLATALKCDPDLIFEYVYNNIEYEPLFGSNKGPLGTLLDLRGNDIDQAQLFTALLSAAGFPASSMSYEYGYIRVWGNEESAAAKAPGWLGVKDDGQAIGNLLANGGIPIGTVFINSDGTLDYVDVAHVWVQLQINGTTYVFDPSFKQHAITPQLANLPSILGYTQSQFLSDAGGSTDSVSVADLNRANIRGDLVAYASNLIGYIKAQNPAWTLNDVAGGKTIEYLTGSPLRQTSLPYLSPNQPSGFPQNWGAVVPNAYRTCFTISMPGVTAQPCSSVTSQNILLYSDQYYGQRITLFSTGSGCAPPSCTPTLLIGGQPPPNGQNTGTAANYGNPWTVTVDITHAYGGAQCSPSSVNQCTGLTLTAGGSYLIGNGWGQVGRGMVEKHRTLLAQAQAAGNLAASEAVLGESLAVISYTWLAEVASAQRLDDAVGQLTTQYHHGVGITAQTAVQQSGAQGPYVDLPLNFLTLQPQTHYSGSGIPPSVLGAFFTISGISSSLESAVLEQTQAQTPGMQAASTVRLVDINAASGTKTFFADGTTSSGVAAYFTNIDPYLAGSCSSFSADRQNIRNQVSSNGTSTGSPTGNQLLVPADLCLQVGSVPWTGAGYTVTAQSTSSGGYSIEAIQKITGGLSGGYSGTSVSTPGLTVSTVDELTPAAGNPAIPAGASAQPSAPGNPTSTEPVDTVTGAYLYQHTDLVTGGGSFPYALTFTRNYSSAANLTDLGLGNGWASGYSIVASRSSDPYRGFGFAAPAGAPAAIAAAADMGENSAINAAAAIAASLVSQDLLSGTESAKPLTVAWVVERWLTDQLTNNAVMVSWPATSEEFTFLPHADGSSSVTYSAPLGSAVVLTGSVPDSYGSYTTFTYTNKDQSRLAFSQLGSAGNGHISSWTFPNGMGLALTYGYSYGGISYLSNVSNNLGRRLNLAYSGAHLATVTDDAGRQISYVYDGNNNLKSYTDPLSNQTTFAYDSAGHLLQIFYPTQPANPFVTNTYDALGRVNQQANADGNTSSFYLAGSRSELIDAAGDRHITYQTPGGRVIKDAWVLSTSLGDVFNDTAQQNGIVNVASNQYDGADRLILATLPEGGTTAYQWSPDLEQNVIQVTQTSKPGSPLAPLVTSYAYDSFYNKPVRITDPLGLVTTLSYDPATGNLLSTVADAGGSGHFNATQSFRYNAVGQVLSAIDPLGTVTQYSYDGFGNPTQIVRDAGFAHLNQTTAMTYSALGDIVSLTDPNGNTTTSADDAERRLTTMTSPPAPVALVTTYSYDPDGRLLQTQQSAAGTVQATTSATYTPSGKIASATDADGHVTGYAYDAVDRLAQLTDAAGRVTTYSYDGLSRRTGLFNPAIQSAALLALGYTPDGHLASLTDANNHATNYTYDGLDRLSITTFPDSSTENLSYDADSNILTRQTRRGDTLTFTYDTLNRLASKAAPGEAAMTYGYDLASRPTSISDNSAAITAPSTTASYAATTTFDAMNRPRQASWSPAATQTAPTASAVTFTHGYDPTNRRISQNATDNSWWSYPPNTATTTIGYTANKLNQYSMVASVSPTYDGNGNLTYDGMFTYGYDAESRLTSVLQGGTAIASYTYDAQGRRKSKTVGTTTTVYATDVDNREVLEYDGTSGTAQRWYAFGGGPDAVLGQMNVAAGTRETMIPDIQGSIIGMLDSTGTLSKTGYQPYGENPILTAGTFQYTARRFDPETAGSTSQPSGLYYDRARTYSPTWGRFLQPDPIGYAAGPNLYAYTNNDPLNNDDPSGLDTLQFGGNIGYTLPFGLSGTFFAGVVFDTQGGVAVYYGGGLGYGSGAGAAISLDVAYSNAKTVSNLGGAFTAANIGAGSGGRIGVDTFYGPSENGFVGGAGLSAGVGLGGTSYAGPTNTVIVPLSSGQPAIPTPSK